jgi:hypothetical protein
LLLFFLLFMIFSSLLEVGGSDHLDLEGTNFQRPFEVISTQRFAPFLSVFAVARAGHDNIFDAFFAGLFFAARFFAALRAGAFFAATLRAGAFLREADFLDAFFFLAAMGTPVDWF